MKTLILAIGILVIGIIGFVLFSKTSEAPNEDSNGAMSEVDESVEVEAVPIQGEDDVEETEVVSVVDTVETMGEEKVFTLDSFGFGYSETELRVKEGDTVTINLTNSDGFHDWVVDEFSAATEKIKAGDTTSVTFVADKKGTFEYYCSVGNHRAQGMVGNLIVE